MVSAGLVNYKKRLQYNVEPIFNMKNSFYLSVKGIIRIRLVHIIYIIFLILKEKNIYLKINNERN